MFDGSEIRLTTWDFHEINYQPNHSSLPHWFHQQSPQWDPTSWTLPKSIQPDSLGLNWTSTPFTTFVMLYPTLDAKEKSTRRQLSAGEPEPEFRGETVSSIPKDDDDQVRWKIWGSRIRTSCPWILLFFLVFFHSARISVPKQIPVSSDSTWCSSWENSIIVFSTNEYQHLCKHI